VRDAERELVPACRAFGLGTLVWSPLARGFLSGKYQRGQPPPPGSRLSAWSDSFKQFDNERCWRVLDAVRTVAQRRGATPASVALAWLLARPEATTVIVGARDVRQLEDNLSALQLRLEPEDAAALDAASAPEWGYPYAFIGFREPW
jgi:aryl-alcohol dehydrogenase-like predicted oxidoreductase